MELQEVVDGIETELLRYEENKKHSAFYADLTKADVETTANLFGKRRVTANPDYFEEQRYQLWCERLLESLKAQREPTYQDAVHARADIQFSKLQQYIYRGNIERPVLPSSYMIKLAPWFYKELDRQISGATEDSHPLTTFFGLRFEVDATLEDKEQAWRLDYIGKNSTDNTN